MLTAGGLARGDVARNVAFVQPGHASIRHSGAWRVSSGPLSVPASTRGWLLEPGIMLSCWPVSVGYLASFVFLKFHRQR